MSYYLPLFVVLFAIFFVALFVAICKQDQPVDFGLGDYVFISTLFSGIVTMFVWGVENLITFTLTHW